MIAMKIETDIIPLLDEMGIAEVPAGTFLMSARDGETLLGIGMMRAFEAGYVSVDNIVFKDGYNGFEMQYGLAKAMLNFADMRGIHIAVSNNGNMKMLLRSLRFEPISQNQKISDITGDDWEYCLNLEGYFSSNC